MSPKFDGFSYSYVCISIFLILFVLSSFRNLSIFVKINTFGVVFTIIIVGFILYQGLNNVKEVTFLTNHGMIVMFNKNYTCLFGILCGGFYLHNISLPIYRNAKYPENNVRDVFIGFVLVFLSYALCGILGYIGF